MILPCSHASSHGLLDYHTDITVSFFKMGRWEDFRLSLCARTGKPYTGNRSKPRAYEVKCLSSHHPNNVKKDNKNRYLKSMDASLLVGSMGGSHD